MSQRVRLYREGHDTDDGRRIEQTQWSDGPIPALFEARVIGTVTEIQREDEGWVTGELTTEENVAGLAAEADFDNVEIDMTGEVSVITNARLRAVTLGRRPTWREMWIGDD
ncbi:MAG TPA: hypothetical protein VMT27_07655 [Actinomycetes bacterium]|nr:hypothetical protein [Actinomycetes bacterium]